MPFLRVLAVLFGIGSNSSDFSKGWHPVVQSLAASSAPDFMRVCCLA
ncbi:hypothetical protein P353_10665 [Comamonas testosteroni]|uniref:Uncharacterized protein n=1 Tax=Comamonas testosteroni TaxID=285 RepID=A0A096GZ06_COMTE|nr:hypothetical protein P353_10665 [Comamonas testosteroni]KWT69634.1 hypothetical protein APV28_2477 [Comamonas testosteroni]